MAPPDFQISRYFSDKIFGDTLCTLDHLVESDLEDVFSLACSSDPVPDDRFGMRVRIRILVSSALTALMIEKLVAKKAFYCICIWWQLLQTRHAAHIFALPSIMWWQVTALSTLPFRGAWHLSYWTTKSIWQPKDALELWSREIEWRLKKRDELVEFGDRQFKIWLEERDQPPREEFGHPMEELAKFALFAVVMWLALNRVRLIQRKITRGLCISNYLN